MPIVFDEQMFERGLKMLKKLSPDIENPEELLREAVDKIVDVSQFFFDVLKDNEHLDDDDRAFLAESFGNVLFSLFIHGVDEKTISFQVLPQVWSRLHGLEVASLVRGWRIQQIEKSKEKKEDPTWMSMFA